MDNRSLIQEQNRTMGSCSTSFNTISYKYLNNALLFFGFPTTTAIIVKLLTKVYKTRSFSPAEVFLLQINFTNICLFMSLLVHFLDAMQIHHFSMTVYMVFYSPTLTARPVFLLIICVIFYLAIVHPVTYMTVKTWRHWEWLVSTFIWIGTLATILAIILDSYDFSNPVFEFTYFIILPIAMFFNITTLRALASSRPGNSAQNLSPAKRKAFQIILSILVVLLLYFLPRVFVFIYPYIAPMDWQRFQCAEGYLIMMLPKFSEFAMPVIFLYSFRKLCV